MLNQYEQMDKDRKQEQERFIGTLEGIEKTINALIESNRVQAEIRYNEAKPSLKITHVRPTGSNALNIRMMNNALPITVIDALIPNTLIDSTLKSGETIVSNLATSFNIVFKISFKLDTQYVIDNPILLELRYSNNLIKFATEYYRIYADERIINNNGEFTKQQLSNFQNAYI